MPEIKIHGYKILFPYEPYKCQLDYMDKVINALSTKSIAVLESPTGTGKTLCLLCAVLGWQKAQNETAKFSENILKHELDGKKNIRPKFQIYYLSRTHNQLQQVIKELKKTEYTPKMTVLGSRDHLCVHEEVKKINNTISKNNSCGEKIKKNSCFYYSNTKKDIKIGLNAIFDIEEVAQACRACSVCPFYYVRHLAENAEILLMPYNYLIDPRNRTSNNMELENAIIIIDEAHNIGQACEETEYRSPSNDEICSYSSCVKLLTDAGFLLDSIDFIEKFIKELVEFLIENSTSTKNTTYLIKFSNFVTFILKTCQMFNEKTLEYFRLCIRTNTNSQSTDFKKRNVNLMLWCFSPSIAIKQLRDKSKGAHSLIFTSGTLSPLSSFESELQIEGSIKLENCHVIDNNQLKIFVLSVGCDDSTALISTYEHRDNQRYLSVLGQTIHDIIMHIPGGVLVFFPSYTAMNITIKEWKVTEIWKKINNVKKILVETKDATNFKTSSMDFVKNASQGNIFLAVCRGKMSEGFDFSDDSARAVIITGLPFALKSDDRIGLKIEVLNKCKQNGSKWYSQQAMQAVNQAIGRVIRHRHDYGLVFLLDERFRYFSNRSQLCKWNDKFLKDFKNFRSLIDDIKHFFAQHRRNNLNKGNPQVVLGKRTKEQTNTNDNNNIYDIYVSNKENFLNCDKNESIFTKIKKTASFNESDSSFQMKAYNSNESSKSKIRLKYSSERDGTLRQDKKLIVSQLITDLKKHLKTDNYILFYKYLLSYLENKDILKFMQGVDPILSIELLKQLEKIILEEHKTTYIAHMEQLCSPNPIETLLNGKPERRLKCSKCDFGAPFLLPCGHEICSRCFAECAQSGNKCLI
ncbi:hypothetical protein HZS_4326, partial [Henneguya salminicola]